MVNAFLLGLLLGLVVMFVIGLALFPDDPRPGPPTHWGRM
jgi:hypothetical protein